MASRIVRAFLQLRCLSLLQLCTICGIVSLISAENAILRFRVEPSDVIAPSGKTPVAFSCAVEPNDELTQIQWLHNGTEIHDNNHRSMVPDGSLFFQKVRRRFKGGGGDSDVGDYQCVARTSTAALLSRKATLRVAEIHPFNQHPENATVREGVTVRFSCQLKSLPTADITWTFNNQSINYETFKRHDSPTPGVLYIQNAQPGDAGEYRCVGSNSVVSRTETSAAGALKVDPGRADSKNTIEFVSPPMKRVLTPVENESVWLECGVGGLSTAKVAWLFKKAKFAPETLIEESPRPYSVLKKSSVSEDDSGTYTCIASRPEYPGLNITRSVEMIVMTIPIVTVEPKVQTVPVARGTRFACSARGHPHPGITWLHNGKPVTDQTTRSPFRITETELILASPSRADAGIYQCVANNLFSEASAYGQLFINDSLKSMAPFNLQCVSLNSSTVQLSWDIADEDEPKTRPRIVLRNEEEDDDSGDATDLLSGDDGESSEDPDAPRRAYSVNYSRNFGAGITEERAVPTTSNTIEISNLFPKQNYTFYVKAFNGASGSEPSESVTCETLDTESDSETTMFSARKPPPPLFSSAERPRKISAGPPLQASSNFGHLDLARLNDTAIRVSWKFEKPKMDHDTYRVVCKNTSGSILQSKPVEFEDKGVTFTDLDPKSLYEFQLNIILNGTTEGAVATETGRTTEYVLDPPTNVETMAESATSLRVRWTRPRADRKIAYYIIRYAKLGTNPTDPVNMTPQMVVQSKKTEAVVPGLEPNATYSIQVEAFDDRKGRSGFSTPVETVMLYEDTTPVQDLRSEVLNSSTVRIWWKDPNGMEIKDSSYTVTYNPDKAHARLQPSHTSESHFVDLGYLEPDTLYHVEVHLTSASGLPGAVVGSTKFYLQTNIEVDTVAPNQDETWNVFLGIPLNTKEQQLGVAIGVLISVCLVVACCAIMCVCMRRQKKRYRQVATGSRPPKEKHEMKVFAKNVNGCAGQLNNGYGNHKAQAESPLLFANGHCPPKPRENGQITGGVRGLSPSHSSGSLLNATVSSGDSGYSDPLQSNSGGPRLLRKCSEEAIDDGFCDGDGSAGADAATSSSKVLTAV